MHLSTLSPAALVILSGGVLATVIPARPANPVLMRRFLWVAAPLLVGAALCRLFVEIKTLQEQSIFPWPISIQAIAGAWLHGQTLYPPPSSGRFYGLLYGPLLFEILGFSKWIFGIGSPLSAVPMVLSEAAALVVTGFTLRRMQVSRFAAAAAVGAMIAELPTLYLAFRGGVFADPCLLLLASLALATLPSLERGRSQMAFVTGLCGGLCMAFKVTAIAYAAPALVTALRHPDARRISLLAWAAPGFLLGFVLPYLAAGGSIGEMIARHAVFLAGLRPMSVQKSLLAGNVLWSLAMFGIPLLWWPGFLGVAENRRLLIGLLVPLIPILFFGAINGAGLWHLLPFLPMGALLLGRTLSAPSLKTRRHWVLLASFCAMVIIGAAADIDQFRRLSRLEAPQASTHAALIEFLNAHNESRIAIGSSDGERHDAVPIYAETATLVQAGQPLFFLTESWADMQTSENAGFLLRKGFDTCHIQYWLMPPGDPFYAGSFMDERIHDQFLKLYQRTESQAGFDVWSCRAGPASPD